MRKISNFPVSDISARSLQQRCAMPGAIDFEHPIQHAVHEIYRPSRRIREKAIHFQQRMKHAGKWREMAERHVRRQPTKQGVRTTVGHTA